MDKYFKVVLFVTFVVIEYLATTSVHIEIVEGMWDKSNHFMAFFVLYMFMGLAYVSMSKSKKIFYLLAFGFQIEFVQYFLPNRYFSFLDIFADFIGILIGVVVYEIVMKKFKATSS